MLICKKVTSDFVVAVSVDKVAERVDITVSMTPKTSGWVDW